MKSPKAKKQKEARGPEPRRQYAALPWRVSMNAQFEILLASSRGTRRWIIQKDGQ